MEKYLHIVPSTPTKFFYLSQNIYLCLLPLAASFPDLLLSLVPFPSCLQTGGDSREMLKESIVTHTYTKPVLKGRILKRVIEKWVFSQILVDSDDYYIEKNLQVQ